MKRERQTAKFRPCSNTSDNISSYVSQISASQEEGAALTAEITNADNSIAQLVQQAEEGKHREAAQAQAEAERQRQEQDAEESSDDYEDTDSYEEDSSDSQILRD
ncbi:MAG: hypothetical protein ACLRTI_11970 [Blautia sp.]